VAMQIDKKKLDKEVGDFRKQLESAKKYIKVIKIFVNQLGTHGNN
jgi:hypothetical protein